MVDIKCHKSSIVWYGIDIGEFTYYSCLYFNCVNLLYFDNDLMNVFTLYNANSIELTT